MSEEIIDVIKETARSLFPSVLEIRRYLHQNPELSFREVNTSAKVKEFLMANEISFTDGWAGHGVVASIEGDHPGPSIVLRADMDALPIQEETDLPFKSVNHGVMHACGHDVHTSSLVGACAIVHSMKKFLHGTIKFVFQPGEEKLPGGASIMIREGLFGEQLPDCIIGQHVFPSLPAGHVGFKPGLYMASADEIYITIRGKGGHAATPHLCIDPVVLGARVVTGLQEIISRQIDPISPAVLTFGRMFTEGGATNIIPDVLYLEGTLRAMDESWRFNAHERIKEFVELTCKASGGSADVRVVVGYPSLKNDEALTGLCREAAVEYLGSECVHELPQRMSSEDFAFYTQEIPGTFYRLGTGFNGPVINPPVHSNKFNVNESALETGMGLMAYMALSYPHRI